MNNLPELDELKKLFQTKHSLIRVEELETISAKGKTYPIHGIIIGSQDKSAPTLGLIGGVHGLERIGSQIIISYLQSIAHQLSWDKGLVDQFQHYRIACIPIVNPAGMALSMRSNPNNVDLMRNAPVEAKKQLFPLLSGHRLSPLLPWYRGKENVLEKESKVLINFVQREIFPSKVSITLDIHSGFGIRDQIWYPFAHSDEKFPLIGEVQNLKQLLDKTYPHHVYKIESQSVNYKTHGDLWDYLFYLHQKEKNLHQSLFLPLTLEIGSWIWLRKNPIQLFSKLGLFHPIKQHRHSRIMRRHILMLDFLLRAVKNHQSWII